MDENGGTRLEAVTDVAGHVTPGRIGPVAAEAPRIDHHDPQSTAIAGCGSDVITTAGQTVSVREVEGVVATCPGVADVVVAGMPDERLGRRIAALVRLAPGAALTARDISAHVGRHLAGHKRPRAVVFVDEVRRTASGEADRRWAAALVSGELGPQRFQRC